MKPWWMQLGGQSRNGILLNVGAANREESDIRNVVTEILLYAAVTKADPASSDPLNSSSSKAPDESIEESLKQEGPTVKVFALPLCSNVIGLLQRTTASYPPVPTEPQSAAQAYFLPYTHDSTQPTQILPQKRQSITTLFEVAKDKRRKSKGRGGESISQAMATIHSLPSQHETQEKQEASQPQHNDLRRRSLSRTSSMTPVVRQEHPRPISRPGPLANAKRSSLHRVESALSPRDTPTPSIIDGSYEQQNKAGLTKVVMAAMRLHGLQQKRKRPSISQLPIQEKGQNERHGMQSEAEDEYKLVYHQTFKAAIFTFRKSLDAMLISQERMRDVVDRLLIMFCTDPMMEDRHPDNLAFQEYATNNDFPSSSPFDKPSTQARSTAVVDAWNTPTTKKR